MKTRGFDGYCLLIIMTMIYQIARYEAFALLRPAPRRLIARSLSSQRDGDPSHHPINAQANQMIRDKFPALSDRQWMLVEAYADGLIDWNSRINIISRKDIHNIMTNHIIPSLSMSLVCSFQPNESIIDVGTGGGLPGIPLAIAFPHCQFTLLDSNSKKITVVQDLITKLNLTNAKAIWSRAEAVSEKYDHLVGRAGK
jgi:16S rRNA (guanine527-N7)-methyltransferase